MLLNKCANACADKLLERCSIPVSRKPVFVYGFELTFSTLSSFCSVLILSAVFQSPAQGALFLATYFCLRLFCGGYHAKTYAQCFLSTNATFLAVLLLARLFPLLHMPWLLFLPVVPANVLIFAWAPVKNAHHPLSEGRRRRNRNIARALAILFDLLCAALYVLSPDFLLPMFSLSGAAVAALMIQPKIQEGRNAHA